MPMFHFTQSFLTGLLQNYARQMDLEIDKLVFRFEFYKDKPLGKPDKGAYV